MYKGLRYKHTHQNSGIAMEINQSELIVLHKEDVKSALVRQVLTKNSDFVFASFFWISAEVEAW